MKYSEDLVKRKIAVIKGKKWYHQRFDGCPHFIHYVTESEIKSEPRKKGLNFNVHVCFFKNDRADWYIALDEMERITQKMIELAKTDNKLSQNMISDWKEDQKIFYYICKKISKTNIKDLTDKALFRLFREFSDRIIDAFTCSSIIDGFALGSDEIIAEMILEVLKRKGMEKNYPEIFSNLTAPVDQSFINKAEVGLLRIAQKIEHENHDLKKFILAHSVDESLAELQKNRKYKKILTLLNTHEQKYFWSKNNYVHANILDKKHFLKEIKEIFEIGLNIGAEIKKISETPKINKETKKKIIRQLGLSQHLKNLIKISEDFTYWQDRRKKITYGYIHYGSILLDEIGKRKGLSSHEIKYLNSIEVKKLKDKNVDEKYKKLIREREKECAEFAVDDECVCVIDFELEELKKAVLGSEDYSKIREFKGLCASPGYAKGKVKICKSATEVAKVNKGDVLVAVMTRPDYVAGMKKAAAIVTEEGGITCHAAIVSRELKIPCVIGTRIATKALKDGDIIEVDATRGIVRKL